MSGVGYLRSRNRRVQNRKIAHSHKKTNVRYSLDKETNQIVADSDAQPKSNSSDYSEGDSFNKLPMGKDIHTPKRVIGMNMTMPKSIVEDGNGNQIKDRRKSPRKVIVVSKNNKRNVEVLIQK